ncbi:cobalamin-dependent protein [bacterium]|nr:cobalamin-dependent protein [candidate division CSSED10-310 bacterium]
MSPLPKILLIHPSFSAEEHYGKLSRVAPSLLPVSLVYLASYMEQHGYEVSIFDGQVEEMSETTLRRRFTADKPDVVGITCMTPMAAEAHRTAAIAKETLPDALVVMGGIHPTILPEETMADAHVDVLVRGEGELTFLELVKTWSDNEALGSVPGLTYREDGRVVHTAARPFIEDLDTLPFPALHLIPMERYHQIPDATFALPLRGIITSRGCPFKCIFCSARQISGFKYRYRSPENVLEEVDILVRDYGARQLAILDDNFVVDRDRTMGICEGLIRRGYHKRLVYTCAARADQVDLELLKTMKRSGCKLVSFGVETGTQRLLDLIQKDLDQAQLRTATSAAKRAGLLVRGTLILGLPTETYEDSLATIRFAKELALDFVKFSLATPYPGTVLYDIAKRQGLVDDRDWSRFSSMAGFTDYDPVFAPEGRSAAELKQLQMKATREFYLRPRQIMYLIRNIHSFKDMKMYFYAAQSLLASKYRRRS